MKISLKTLKGAVDPLNKLLLSELPTKQLYRIKKLLQAADAELKICEDMRIGLVKKYGIETSPDNWQVSPENFPAFQTEFNEFLETEVDLPGEPIKLDALPEMINYYESLPDGSRQKRGLTTFDLMLLDWLIEE